MAKGKTRVRIVYNNLPRLARQIPDAAMEAVTETVVEMDQMVKAGMTAGGSGRIYGTHRASAPGEMPAVDLGNLIASLTVEFDRAAVRGFYYTANDYAPHLEYGAPAAGIEPRPFMTVAAEAVRDRFMARMRDLESHLR